MHRERSSQTLVCTLHHDVFRLYYISHCNIRVQQNATKYMCDYSFSSIFVLVYHNGISHVNILTVHRTGFMDTTCMHAGKSLLFLTATSVRRQIFFISAKCHHSGIIFQLSSTDDATRYGLNGSGSRASYPSEGKRLSRSNIRPDQLRGWSEKFSASTRDGKTIGKIFFA
jgi:hypothetical protein